MSGRVWVVSELYFPEETSTGLIMTKIAEGLGESFRVAALTGPLTYAARGTKVPRHEERNGVSIHRVASTAFDKNLLLGRAANTVVLSFSLFGAAAKRLRQGDVAIVVTNPPTLPFLLAAACSLRGARFVLLVHDVYPDATIAAGLLPRRHPLVGLARWAVGRLYRRSDHVVAIGRDMQALIEKIGPGSQVAMIPNWADLDLVQPRDPSQNALLTELGLTDRFVIQYAGNIGRTHDLEILINAAHRLARVDERVHFLVIGSGARKTWLEAELRRRSLPNVTLLSPLPRCHLDRVLNACHVGFLSFQPGMAGISVPSRLYNVLAVGKPVIAVCDADSELAMVLRQNDLGWVVPPRDVDSLVKAIKEAAEDRTALQATGVRAREVAESYSLRSVIESYSALVRQLR